MKVEGNITIFAGDSAQTSMLEKAEREQKEGSEKQGNSIYAGNFQGDMSIRDRIQQKREQAQAQAMKVVKDAWDGERAIDDELSERRAHIRELTQSNGEAQGRIDQVREKQQELQEAYGVTEDSAEQQELELLRRKNAADRGEGSLTEEELEQCARIEKRGLTEYQQRQLRLDEDIHEDEKLIQKNDQTVMMENAIIRGIRRERPKSHRVVDAQKQAEKIKDAAGDEIMGMLVEDGREHVDEEQKEREEQAEKLQEKKEEQEELIEERREDREEAEELVEDMPVDEMLDMSKTQDEIQQEVQDIVNKMALVAEDIKGAMVDTTV